jgi:hypothetical protein
MTADNGDLSLVSNQCDTCSVQKKYDATTGSGTLVTGGTTPNTFTEMCAISLGNDFKTS